MNYFRLSMVVVLLCIFAPMSVVAQDEYDEDDVIVIRGLVEGSDSSENMNRGTFDFNHTIDDVLFAPVARGYRYTVPKWGRTRVSNVVNNLNTPAVFMNSILQGKSEKAFQSFWRFIINTTFGIGGLFDFASAAGLEPVREDFGQTLAVWGNKESDYLVLPILGPSTNRDTIGFIVDTLTNPVSYIALPASLIIQGTKYVSKREEFLDVTDEIEENSFDPYATIRSAYFQNRTEEIGK